MATNKLLNPIFDYGDIVVIKQDAPIHYRPSSMGSVCGIRTIDSLDIAQQFDQVINSELYLIEFDDGQTLEIPKSFLILYFPEINK